MSFELTILGSSSATPSFGRFPTAQVLRLNEQLFLIDCGEGTQIQLHRYDIKSSKINHIFISHLHGDHYFGLIGLLSSMHLLGRTTQMHIYAQAILKDIIELQLKASQTQLRFELIFHPVSSDKSVIILDESEFTVSTIPLNHRIPCTGFIFREKDKPLKLNKEKLDELAVPVAVYTDLKKGMDYTSADGKVIANVLLTFPPSAPKSYAFCSDTIYDESIAEAVKGVDLLYHESTFLNELLERAQETYHTTALQAGTIAQKAGVKKLIIGHFSSRYKQLDPLLQEARSVFPNTDLAVEGMKFIL